MTRFFLALLMGIPRLGSAALLAEFNCVRPRAVDSGTWHNVTLAASLVNGVEIQAGEEFSFLKAMSGGAGKFLPGNTFSSGRVIKSTGGGYCQVSTSIYNAALLAGLQVLERYPHSFYDAEDAYVPAGQDAAVSGSNHADFRFLNSTPSALTLRAAASGGRVSIQIYGVAPVRKRWLSLESSRIPMRRLKRPGQAQREGHDGWRVRRTLNVVDASGNTRSVFLGEDAYDMVAQID
jgi:vancomycin resistance protein YoaR